MRCGRVSCVSALCSKRQFDLLAPLGGGQAPLSAIGLIGESASVDDFEFRDGVLFVAGCCEGAVLDFDRCHFVPLGLFALPMGELYAVSSNAQVPFVGKLKWTAH